MWHTGEPARNPPKGTTCEGCEFKRTHKKDFIWCYHWHRAWPLANPCHLHTQHTTFRPKPNPIFVTP